MLVSFSSKCTAWDWSHFAKAEGDKGQTPGAALPGCASPPGVRFDQPAQTWWLKQKTCQTCAIFNFIWRDGTLLHIIFYCAYILLLLYYTIFFLYIMNIHIVDCILDPFLLSICSFSLLLEREKSIQTSVARVKFQRVWVNCYNLNQIWYFLSRLDLWTCCCDMVFSLIRALCTSWHDTFLVLVPQHTALLQ